MQSQSDIVVSYIDTNILIRLLTYDVPKAAAQAAELIESQTANQLVVPDVVLVELFFVLEYREPYLYKRLDIVRLFRQIISTPQFSLSKTALAAFEIYSGKPALNFVDCLLIVLADHKKSRLHTFDKDLLKDFK